MQRSLGVISYIKSTAIAASLFKDVHGQVSQPCSHVLTASSHFHHCIPLDCSFQTATHQCLPNIMEGYSKVADLMGQHAELGIFRRFQFLNMLNLLYRQAELTELDLELLKLDLENCACQDERRYYAKYWPYLSNPGLEVDNG